MFINKGTKLLVNHQRKGVFKAVALEDFDSEMEEFYPLATTEQVNGIANTWKIGQPIPCRASFCSIKVVD